MEFPNLETLQSFLAHWLEQHGHKVYCRVPVPTGQTVDILTQDYVIHCVHTLTDVALQVAAEEIQGPRGHFPDQQSVIAGLTPDQQWDPAYAMAETLKDSGIEVWFVDQMPPFVSYYAQIAKRGDIETAHPVRKAPWGGCLLSVGVAAILGVSLWVAFQILERHETQVATTTQDERRWEQLHGAVTVWDINRAQMALDQLATNPDPCVVKFADQFSAALEQQGPEGFRAINPIKRALNQQEGCRLDIQEYEFSP